MLREQGWSPAGVGVGWGGPFSWVVREGPPVEREGLSRAGG